MHYRGEWAREAGVSFEQEKKWSLAALLSPLRWTRDPFKILKGAVADC